MLFRNRRKVLQYAMPILNMPCMLLLLDAEGNGDSRDGIGHKP